ncbi:UvrD-helicase domain-containing protein [Curtobacterium sp. 24E2]|nr:ATP-dependent helicase [Curtobacterium sp. 24E2]
MITPTAKQHLVRSLPNQDVLIVAPAGCGKTEALAFRVQGLLERGEVSSPCKVLVVTFSLRARDNIRERLETYLTAGVLRERVTIANFHGFSARVYRAHANVIGANADLRLPDSDWVGEEIRRRGIGWDEKKRIDDILREVKQQPLTDEEVVDELVRRGNDSAVSIEKERVRQGLLTYDDLPRVAELILANDQVADLYRAHFGAVIVDEYQDLTPQQFRIVCAIGREQTTFAGDLAQGIYGFAGAMPATVDKNIREVCQTVVELTESHRSAPAVLGLTNALTPVTGGVELTSAAPETWPGGGLAGSVAMATASGEASWIAGVAAAIHSSAPRQRIGVLTRTGPRRRFLDEAFAASDVPAMRWDDPLLDIDTARAMRALLLRLDGNGFSGADDKIALLRSIAEFEAIVDVDARRRLSEAMSWAHDLLVQGVARDEVRRRVRVGDAAQLLKKPGVHLLTGHVGKGQQFDWVFVAGLEEGVLPDFRSEDSAEEARVLSVMISRARHGVILSYARSVPTASGYDKRRSRSTLMALTDKAGPRTLDGVIDWFRSADWAAIRER